MESKDHGNTLRIRRIIWICAFAHLALCARSKARFRLTRPNQFTMWMWLMRLLSRWKLCVCNCRNTVHVKRQWCEHWWLVNRGWLELVFEPQGNICTSNSSRKQIFRDIFNDRFYLPFFVATHGFRERDFDYYSISYLSAYKSRPNVSMCVYMY